MWLIDPVGFFIALLMLLPGTVSFAFPVAWRWVCVTGAVCSVAFSVVPISYYGPEGIVWALIAYVPMLAVWSASSFGGAKLRRHWQGRRGSSAPHPDEG